MPRRVLLGTALAASLALGACKGRPAEGVPSQGETARPGAAEYGARRGPAPETLSAFEVRAPAPAADSVLAYDEDAPYEPPPTPAFDPEPADAAPADLPPLRFEAPETRPMEPSRSAEAEELERRRTTPRTPQGRTLETPAPAPAGPKARVPQGRTFEAPPAPSPEAPRTSATGGAIERPPLKVSGRNPQLPAALRAQGLSGRVQVNVLVRASGEVGTVEVLRADHPDLGPYAVEAVRRWQFSPALKGGHPVEMWLTQSVLVQ